MKLIFANWQLKLVAAFLAVALWLYTSGQVEATVTLHVTVPDSAILGLSSEYRVAEIRPREFSVEVRGPAAALRSIRDAARTPRLEITARGLKEGQQSFALTTTTLELDASIHILATNPANIDAIDVTLGRVVRSEWWLEAPRLSAIPDGIDAILTLEEARTTVTGPEPSLAALRASGERLRFKPVLLNTIDTRISEPTTLRIRLEPEAPQAIEVPPLFAKVLITPSDARRIQLALSVQVLADSVFLANHHVELGESQIMLSVRGPRGLLDRLTSDAVAAFVDLRVPPSLDQPIDLPLRISAPPWLTCDSAQVRVTIRANQPAPTP